MNKKEFMKLHTYHMKIIIDDLEDKSDRTLLYGYDQYRTTQHVYIKDGKIFAVDYDYNGPLREISISDNKDYIPWKRIYPEKSDYEFCKLLIERGHNLPFLPFDESVKHKKFYGRILNEEE